MACKYMMRLFCSSIVDISSNKIGSNYIKSISFYFVNFCFTAGFSFSCSSRFFSIFGNCPCLTEFNGSFYAPVFTKIRHLPYRYTPLFCCHARFHISNHNCSSVSTILHIIFELSLNFKRKMLILHRRDIKKLEHLGDCVNLRVGVE